MNQNLVKVLSMEYFQCNQQFLRGYGISFPCSRNQSKYKGLTVPTVINSCYLPIEGWILANSVPISGIEVRWEDIVVARDLPNLKRQDIKDKFPDIDVGNPGFLIPCNTSYLPLEAELFVYAVLKDQEELKLLKITIFHNSNTNEFQKCQNFFIIFNGRCGSTYLVDKLSKHPQIDSKMENIYQYNNLSQQLCFIDKYFGSDRNENIKAVGFKEQLVNIVEPEKTINYMIHKYSPIIYLMSRKNVLKTAISMIRTELLNKTHGVANATNLSQVVPPSNIPPNKLLEVIKYREKLDADLDKFVEKLKISVKIIFYEEILNNEDELLRYIFRDLGVEAIKIKESSIKKNTSNNLRNALTNFDELVEYFSGTKYEAMLLEGATL